MRKFTLLLFCISFLNLCYAQIPEYHKVKVFANETELFEMAKAGLCVDHGELLKGHWLINVFSDKELERIEALGISYEVQIKDMRTHVENQNKHYKRQEVDVVCDFGTPDYEVPENFKLGTYAGFFTYEEMQENLDSMHAKYPNLISKRVSASDSLRTIEGREIQYVKISDNPNMDEPEPEVFYNGLHHAREPVSMQHLIFYMWYLLENYEKDANIKRVLDNVELYFMPCVNPDGYIFDSTSAPQGGGFWRKNRRENEDGSIGVDLNRNYDYNWGYDDIGSSPDPSSQVYRGTEGFSEPELQIMKEFCEAHEFLITLNCHTIGNLLIYPWGYDYALFTEDSAQFVNYAEVLTKYNDYTYGTGDQTVNYIVNGSSDDWMYGETTTKNKSLALTPESGRPDFGFYPPKAEIIPICKDNIWQNLQTAKLVLGYVEVEDETPIYLSEKSGYIKFKAKRLGMQDESFSIAIISADGNIQTTGIIPVEGLELLAEQQDSIAYTLNDDLKPGDLINFEFKVGSKAGFETNGAFDTYAVQKIYIPEPDIAFEDAFDNSDQWEGDWGISDERSVDGTSVFTDTPNARPGSASGSNLNTKTLDYNIDLRNTKAAILQFDAIWDILARYDNAQISVQKEGDNAWHPLCGKNTKLGNGFQGEGEPIYDGFRVGWIKEEISLADFLGEKLKLQLSVGYNYNSQNDGFYIDNLKVIKQKSSENSPPVAVDDNITITTLDAATVSVLDNDTDFENDQLSIQIVQLPVHGTATIADEENTIINYILSEDATKEETDSLTYAVCDPSGNCDTASVYFNINLIIGINDAPDFIKSISIFPNPANKIININHIQKSGQITLYNSKGQIVKTIKDVQGSTQIDAAGFSEGLYFVHFNNQLYNGLIDKLLIVHK